MLRRIKSIVANNKLAFLIILIAAVFRLYHLEGYITFLGDQGRDAVIVKRIVMLENLPAIGAPSSIGGVYLGPFYYYLISPFLLLWNFNPVGLGYGVALLSIIGITYAYLFAKTYLNHNAAILFLLFMAFSSTLVDMNRYSWNPNLLPYFSFFTLLLFHNWLIERKGNIYGLLFGAFLSFSFQLHYLAGFLFIATGIFWLQRLLKETNRSNLLISTIYPLVSFAFFLLPQIMFDITHDFLNLKGLFALFTEGKVTSDVSKFEGFMSSLSNFYIAAFGLQISNVQVIIITTTLFAGILFFRKKLSTFLQLHIINVVVFLVGFSFLSSSRFPHYYGSIFLSFYLIIGFLASRLFSLKNAGISIVIGLGMAFFLIINVQNYPFVQSKPNNQIEIAQRAADSLEGRITEEPIQIVPLPRGETDGHIRYFLEIKGHQILPEDSPQMPAEMFVICRGECNPTGDPHWQIAAFLDKTLDASWEVEGVTIYKLVHENK